MRRDSPPFGAVMEDFAKSHSVCALQFAHGSRCRYSDIKEAPFSSPILVLNLSRNLILAVPACVPQGARSLRTSPKTGLWRGVRRALPREDGLNYQETDRAKRHRQMVQPHQRLRLHQAANRG